MPGKDPRPSGPALPRYRAGEGRGIPRGRVCHLLLLSATIGPARGRTGRRWGLFYPQPDKALSVADVRVIAQAMLLRQGNHGWKVGETTQNQDNTVGFTIATGNALFLIKSE